MRAVGLANLHVRILAPLNACVCVSVRASGSAVARPCAPARRLHTSLLAVAKPQASFPAARSPSKASNMSAPAAAASKAEPKSFERRDRLRSYEAARQAEWSAAAMFEEDAPTDGSTPEKFFATFPYPYMNGPLHVGHAFTLMKAEFAAAYYRARGRRVLFPFGFHCTGMPIQAAANKLRREAEVAAAEEVEADDAAAEAAPAAAEVAAASASAVPGAPPQKERELGKFVGKKTKAVAKTGQGLTQREILLKGGIAPEEVDKFKDPKYWLKYFPPIGQRDLRSLGLQVDWRRSFITTDANPYYDAFIRWQFKTLRKRDKLGFGKRPTIYSPLDGQACADHDRASGEGVNPQEYTLIKLQLQEVPATHRAAERLAPIKALMDEGKRVYFVAATLRPETMYGQTNCYLLPEGAYGAFHVSATDVFICAERAARNMSYQGLSLQHGVVAPAGEFTGEDLIGLPLSAPYATFPTVYTLPLFTISMAKGTGVVTSVPSDAPDDYAALRDLQKKAALREKFGLTEAMVNMDVVEIIDIPGFGKRAAVKLCEDMKITSQNDKVKLAEAKDKVYMEGFYKGIMLVGKYAGQRVCDAKPLVRADMLAAGLAAQYWEPESQVISRSGDECVVAELDQWYLKYGEEEWRATVEAWIHSSGFRSYNPATLRAFEVTLGWLKEWACSRNFGLGTRVPWDTQFVIESLSDSTIYMAYYTIAHLLQGGNVDPDVVSPGPAGIRPEQLTDAVFDYVFLGGAYPTECGVPEATLAQLRREFEFWYPMDLRVSGKDLIQNHLTFALYNHAAMWNGVAPLERRMPQSYFCNGHVMIDGSKMSKSAGNFLTIEEGVHLYGTDALRFALAAAGDGMEDANLERSVADNAILRLTSEDEFAREVFADIAAGKLRAGEFILWDRVFESRINRSIVASQATYEAMRFREAVADAFFNLQAARDAYREACTKLNVPMHADVMRRFVEVQFTILAPICPHLCETIWKDVLKRPGSVLRGSWPVAGPVDESVLAMDTYLQSALHTFFVQIQKTFVGKPKGGVLARSDRWAKAATIYISRVYPAWQSRVLGMLRENFNAAHISDTNPYPFPADIRAIIKTATLADPSTRSLVTKVMDFTGTHVDAHRGLTTPLATLSGDIPFDEAALWTANMEYVRLRLNVPDIRVACIEDAGVVDTDPTKKAKDVTPGAPSIHAWE